MVGKAISCLKKVMNESKIKFSGAVRVFVYGTLKPGEANYQRYCAGKLVNVQRAIALGKLFALPLGYPAMTVGDTPVQGYLLYFADAENLTELDQLEDYQTTRQKSENLYNREQIEIFNQDWLSLGQAWVYLMSLERVRQLKGIPQLDGWWSGCGLIANQTPSSN